MDTKGITILLLLYSCFAVGQEKVPGKEGEDLSLDPSVRYGQLDNGFTYYLRHNQAPPDRIYFNLVVKAGSYHENEDQLDYAHLLEHLGASATKHFPDVDDYFDGPDKYSSAKTDPDHTRYHLTIPADDKKMLYAGLQLLRDQAQDILFKDEILITERGAVLGEMRTNDPYSRWTFNTITKQVVEGTGLTYTDPHKLKTSIENIDKQALYKFYEDWYRPDLQAAIIVGDINVDSVERRIIELFSDLKIQEKVRDAQERVDAQKVELPGRIGYKTITDTIDNSFKLSMVIKRINHGYRPRSRIDYRNMLLQGLYGEIMDSRIERLAQQYNPPFSSFLSKYRANSIANGQLTVALMDIPFKNDRPQVVKRKFIDAIVAWRRVHHKWTRAELDKAKDKLHKIFLTTEPVSSIDLGRKYVAHFTGGAAAPHPEIEQALIAKLLKEIDLEEIQNFAQMNGSVERDVDFIFFTGGDDIIPKQDKIRQWISEAEKKKIIPLESENSTVISLDDVVKIPFEEGVKVEQICNNMIGVSVITLKNGIRLVLKPTRPRIPFLRGRVSIHAFRPNAIPVEEEEKFLTSQIAPEVILFSGAGSYSKFELERFMEKNNIWLRFGLDKDIQMIEAKGSSAKIEELLKLLYMVTTQPRQDKEAFAAWKDQKREFLKSQPRSSADFYVDSIQTRWFPQVPILTAKDLEQLKMRDIFNIFQKEVSTFEDYSFIVTGDFDQAILAPVLVDHISSFPVRQAERQTANSQSYFPLKRISDTIFVENFDQAAVSLFFPVKAKGDVKTKAQLELISRALHQGIYRRLRIGSYSPRASGEWLDIGDGIYAFHISFDSELGDEESMVSIALEVLRELRQNGVDQNWLKKAIAAEKKEYSEDIDSFGYVDFWAAYLQEKLESNEDLTKEVLSYEAVLEHFISLEEINSAIKEYLNEDNVQKFIVLPKGYNSQLE